MDLPDIVCSCGAPIRDDALWPAILQAAGFDAATLERLWALEQTVCRTGFLLRRRLSLAAIRADAEVAEFLALQDRLFAAIARVSGRTVVVDSSKAGPRALLLASGGRARILHLSRDPADVIASWRSVKFDPGLNAPMKRMPVLRAAIDWLKAELTGALLARRGLATWVDYGALCRQPRETTARAIAALGLDGTITPAWLTADCFEPDACYHSLNGNPDRFTSGPVTIAERRPSRAGQTVLERGGVRATAMVLRLVAGLLPPPRAG